MCKNVHLTLPYGYYACSVQIFYGYIDPGAWLICPVGGLKALLTGRVDAPYLLPFTVGLISGLNDPAMFRDAPTGHIFLHQYLFSLKLARICKDYHFDYVTRLARLIKNSVKKFALQGINLLDKGSLARCALNAQSVT